MPVTRGRDNIAAAGDRGLAVHGSGPRPLRPSVQRSGVAWQSALVAAATLDPSADPDPRRLGSDMWPMARASMLSPRRQSGRTVRKQSEQ